jgi:hypothetical protein
VPLSEKQITDNRNCPIRSLEGLTPGKFRSSQPTKKKKGQKGFLEQVKASQRVKANGAAGINTPSPKREFYQCVTNFMPAYK